MSILSNRFAILAIKITLIGFTNIAFGATIYDELKGDNRYEHFKGDSFGENRKIFDTYESKNSSKVIYICIPDKLRYAVGAVWDANIKTLEDAELIAEDECGKDNADYFVLGYKINMEQRF